MRIVAANHSSYPASRGPDALARLIREQIDAGLDVLTDGHIGWAHPVETLFARLDGARLGSPSVLPGLSGSPRQPIVQAKLRRRRMLIIEEYRRAAALSAVPVKVVLTGPYTLSRTAALATTAYRDANALADDLAALLAQEVAALAAIGAPLLQVDEPLVLSHRTDPRHVRELLEPIYDAANGSTQVIVATYGADASAVYAELNSLPADVIALDCTYPVLCDAVATTGSGKPLALGIVNGAMPAADDVDAIARLLERLLQRYVHDLVYLQPSCGLGALPSEAARAKLHTLAALRQIASGGST